MLASVVVTEASTTDANIAHSFLNNNSFGVSAGGSSQIWLFASQLSHNAQSVNTFNGGVVNSHGNNAILNNTTNIVPPNVFTQYPNSPRSTGNPPAAGRRADFFLFQRSAWMPADERGAEADDHHLPVDHRHERREGVVVERREARAGLGRAVELLDGERRIGRDNGRAGRHAPQHDPLPL